METVKPRNTLKVTIHPDAGTNLTTGGWPINTEPEIFESEPERVSIEKDGISYSLVFEGKSIKLEVWEVDAEGELGILKKTINIL